jgi:hypothetical protein
MPTQNYTFSLSSSERQFTINLVFDGENLMEGSAQDDQGHNYDVLLHMKPRTEGQGSICCCTPGAGCWEGSC